MIFNPVIFFGNFEKFQRKGFRFYKKTHISKHPYFSDLFSKNVNAPDLGVMDALLYKTGTISIRPIETESFSSFVDVGVSTGQSNEPADMAVIYDIPSNSWYCD